VNVAHRVQLAANRALVGPRIPAPAVFQLEEQVEERIHAVDGTPADCVKKLERTIEAGARQFWMSIHFDDKLRLLRDFAEQVIPAFR
jgi:alkanesulfonate monooxygenase SsuD/methylene tetrahydromethanopterin reductase-like flavin-dependent oxidoreductase (luciferase family)